MIDIVISFAGGVAVGFCLTGIITAAILLMHKGEDDNDT